MTNTYISVLGSCATGKSTRVNAFIDHLDNVLKIPYTVDDYTFTKNGEEVTIKNAGRLYNNGLYIVGSKTTKGNWVGADNTFGKLGNKDSIYGYLDFVNKYLKPHTFLVEGYFAVGGAFLRPDALADKFDVVKQYFFIYDTLDQYIERTEGRTGKSWEERGKDPEQSAGWLSNRSFISGMQKSIDGSRDTDSIVSVDHTIDRDYFIREFSDLV